MPLTIDLPQVGETTVEGVIVRWLKQPGDRIARYDPLVEVETDKATMEVPSPASGRVVRLLVNEGDKVAMGAPICEIEEEATAPTPTHAPAGTIGTLQEPGPGFGATGAQPVEEVAQPHGNRVDGHARLSPVVQRLAAEHRIPLDEVARIKGSGLEGRITKQDLLAYVERRSTSASAPPPPPLARAPAAAAPSIPAAPAPAIVERPIGPDEEVLQLTPVRRRIAENTARSAREIPSAWTVFEVDVTGLVRWRNAAKGEFQHKEGVELTYLPFVAKAVCEALKEHPKLNSTWGGDKIILKKRINLSIAVAASHGVIVPVVQDADQYSIAGLARKLGDLIVKARENRLMVQEVQGGTFTLNNAGSLGAMTSHAIINYPQAAIMTFESITRRVVAIGDAIALRDRMNTTITFDHRIMDGHEASAFMADVKRRLEAMGPEGSIY